VLAARRARGKAIAGKKQQTAAACGLRSAICSALEGGIAWWRRRRHYLIVTLDIVKSSKISGAISCADNVGICSSRLYLGHLGDNIEG